MIEEEFKCIIYGNISEFDIVLRFNFKDFDLMDNELLDQAIIKFEK